MEITVPLAGADDWVKLNADQQVPMRVLYDEAMMARLAKAISSKAMGSSDRAGMLLDSYNLVKAGMMEAGALVRLLSSYTQEDDATVWEAIEMALSGLDKFTTDMPAVNARLQGLAKKLLAPLTEKVGWEARADDEHLTKLLRGTLIRLLSTFSYAEEGVKKEAKEVRGLVFVIFARRPILPYAIAASRPSANSSQWLVVLSRRRGSPSSSTTPPTCRPSPAT